MPNWCNNGLEVIGPPKELERFKKFVTGSRKDVIYGRAREFDFNKVIPYPKEYRELDELALDNERKRADAAKALGKKHTNDLTQKQRDEVFKKYPDIKDGYNQGGYTWCCDNWGTKWNACEVSVSGKPKDGSLHYGFDTAWGPPEPVIKKLGEMFPKLHLILRYSEPGMGFEGVLEIMNGKVIIDDCYNMPTYRCKKCGNEQVIGSDDDEALCWECKDTGDWELVKPQRRID